MDTKVKKRSVGRKSTSVAGKTGTAKRNGAAVSVKTKPRRTAIAGKATADVVYTQPGPFNRNRFLLRLATVVAVVLALLFGMSIFFKVKTVTVAGTNKYTAWDVREASGIVEGENLLTISEAKLSSNIRSKLPYVDSVRIGIKLPDTVKIEIKELDVVYAIEAEDDSWWLIRADGGVVEKTNTADAQQHTKISGVVLADPQVGQPATAAQPEAQISEDGETIPVTVMASEQLSIVISVLQYLESNGIIGQVTSLDVSDLANIEMWYGERFQVLLGDTTQLSYKISLIKTAINDYMQTYDSGILDASLSIQPDPEKLYQVIYTPFNN